MNNRLNNIETNSFKNEQPQIEEPKQDTIVPEQKKRSSSKAVTFLLTTMKMIGLATFTVFLVIMLLVYLIPWFQNAKPAAFVMKAASASIVPDSTGAVEIDKNKLLKNIENLEKNLAAKLPKTNYLIINTSDNRFQLWSGNKQIRKGLCSTGSYTILKKSDDEKWVFKTPRGVFKIRNKRTSPVWVKPDWAFVEEGLPIPPPRHESRYDNATLGDYAMSLGDGYMIHGTLYKRFLGMPVTHGCIRMGDEDLEIVFNNMPLSGKVFIY